MRARPEPTAPATSATAIARSARPTISVKIIRASSDLDVDDSLDHIGAEYDHQCGEHKQHSSARGAEERSEIPRIDRRYREQQEDGQRRNDPTRHSPLRGECPHK